MAALRGYENIVRILLQHGALVNQGDSVSTDYNQDGRQNHRPISYIFKYKYDSIDSKLDSDASTVRLLGLKFSFAV